MLCRQSNVVDAVLRGIQNADHQQTQIRMQRSLTKYVMWIRQTLYEFKLHSES
jgi:hypothetical protein